MMKLLTDVSVPGYDTTTSSFPVKTQTKGTWGGDDHPHGSQDGYTVEEAVEKIGFGKFQIVFIVITGLVMSAEAMEMMLLSVLTPPLRCEWYLSEVEVALVSTVTFFGMGVGATLGGALADKYGRLCVTRMGTVFVIWYGLLTSIAPSFYWLIFCRCMVGMSLGFGTIGGFTLLSEYIPVKHRARMLVLMSSSWVLGSFFEIFLAAIVIPWVGWRTAVACTSVPAALSLIFLFCIPESPRYLVTHGRLVEAEQILKYMATINNSTLPVGHLIPNKKGKANITELFTGEYCVTTGVLWVMWFGVSWLTYGTLLLNSEILEKEHLCNSESDIIDITLSEVCHCQFHEFEDYVSMAVSTCGALLVIPINMILVDWIGRRRCILLDFLMVAFFYLFLNICMNKVQYTIVIFCIRIFSESCFNMCYIYTVEVYPTTTRGLGLGTGSTCARVGAMLTPFIGQVLLVHSRMSAVLVYACSAAVCGLVSLALPIETMGRQMKQSSHIEDKDR